MVLQQNIRGNRFFTILVNRQNSFTAILLIFFLSGVYLFIFGESGILERISLEHKQVSLMQRILELKNEQAELQEKLTRYQDGYRPESDITDAGLISPGNKILNVEIKSDNTCVEEKKITKDNSFEISRLHFRIIWIIVSAVILILFFTKRMMPKEQINE